MKYNKLISKTLASVAVCGVMLAPIFIIASATPPSPPSNTSLIDNPLKGDEDTIPEVIALILREIVMPLGAVVIVFMIIYSGFNYVVAQGNEDKLKNAHTLFKNVLIGSAIILGATAIAELITRTLANITDAI